MSDQATADARRAVELLAEVAETTQLKVSKGAAGLTLAETGMGLEWLTDVLDAVWTMLGSLNEQTQRLRDREVTERREGSSLDVLDTALVHLACGHDGLMVARHLVGMGRGEVLSVERGEE